MTDRAQSSEQKATIGRQLLSGEKKATAISEALNIHVRTLSGWKTKAMASKSIRSTAGRPPLLDDISQGALEAFCRNNPWVEHMIRKLIHEEYINTLRRSQNGNNADTIVGRKMCRRSVLRYRNQLFSRQPVVESNNSIARRTLALAQAWWTGSL